MTAKKVNYLPLAVVFIVVFLLTVLITKCAVAKYKRYGVNNAEICAAVVRKTLHISRDQIKREEYDSFEAIVSYRNNIGPVYIRCTVTGERVYWENYMTMREHTESKLWWSVAKGTSEYSLLTLREVYPDGESSAVYRVYLDNK